MWNESDLSYVHTENLQYRMAQHSLMFHVISKERSRAKNVKPAGKVVNGSIPFLGS